MYGRRPGITLFGGEASRSGRSMSGIHYKVEKDGRMKLYTEEYSELKGAVLFYHYNHLKIHKLKYIYHTTKTL